MANDRSSLPHRLKSGSSSTDLWWDSLNPGLKAAISVGVVVAALEFLSDVLPVAGFLITIPVAIVLYYVQGILTGRFVKADPRFAGLGPGFYVRSGAISAFWTSLVISTAVTLIDTVILTPLTVGVFLAALPLTLASSAVDIALNFIFTSLGAWLYSRFSGGSLAGISCAILAVVMAGLCLAAAVAAALLVAGGINLLHRR